MNGTKVRDLIYTMGDVHHIFPKKYLYDNEITDKSKYNQIANYIYLDTQINISIGDEAPSKYFKTALEQCDLEKKKYGNIKDKKSLLENLNTNCIPENIVFMDETHFDDFLLERRKLMAMKIKDYYYSL
jgi:hypothetical protein